MNKLFCIALLCAIATANVEKLIVATDKAPAAIGPYSQAVLLFNKAAGSADLHIAGQIGMDANGTLAVGIDAQTKQALENIRNIVEKACEMVDDCRGAGMSDLYQCEVLMADLSQYSELNKVYAEAFGKPPYPARAAYQVSALPKNALTEIKCDANLHLGA